MCSVAVWIILETAHVRSNTAWYFYDQSMEALSSQLPAGTQNEANLILQIPALMCKDVPGTLCARILFLGKRYWGKAKPFMMSSLACTRVTTETQE